MTNPDVAERPRWFSAKFAHQVKLRTPIPHVSQVQPKCLWSPDLVFAEWFRAAWNAKCNQEK